MVSRGWHIFLRTPAVAKNIWKSVAQRLFPILRGLEASILAEKRWPQEWKQDIENKIIKLKQETNYYEEREEEEEAEKKENEEERKVPKMGEGEAQSEVDSEYYNEDHFIYWKALTRYLMLATASTEQKLNVLRKEAEGAVKREPLVILGNLLMQLRGEKMLRDQLRDVQQLILNLRQKIEFCEEYQCQLNKVKQLLRQRKSKLQEVEQKIKMEEMTLKKENWWFSEQLQELREMGQQIKKYEEEEAHTKKELGRFVEACEQLRELHEMEQRMKIREEEAQMQVSWWYCEKLQHKKPLAEQVTSMFKVKNSMAVKIIKQAQQNTKLRGEREEEGGCSEKGCEFFMRGLQYCRVANVHAHEAMNEDYFWAHRTVTEIEGYLLGRKGFSLRFLGREEGCGTREQSDNGFSIYSLRVTILPTTRMLKDMEMPRNILDSIDDNEEQQGQEHRGLSLRGANYKFHEWEWELMRQVLGFDCDDCEELLSPSAFKAFIMGCTQPTWKAHCSVDFREWPIFCSSGSVGVGTMWRSPDSAVYGRSTSMAHCGCSPEDREERDQDN